MEMSILDILKQRLPWLAGLLMLQSVSASIMHGFDTLLEKHLVIAMFIPMIVGSGGNAGNQPGVMVTRALGIGEFRRPGLLRAFIKREGTVISIIATILSVFSFIRVRNVRARVDGNVSPMITHQSQEKSISNTRKLKHQRSNIGTH